MFSHNSAHGWKQIKALLEGVRYSHNISTDYLNLQKDIFFFYLSNTHQDFTIVETWNSVKQIFSFVDPFWFAIHFLRYVLLSLEYCLLLFSLYSQPMWMSNNLRSMSATRARLLPKLCRKTESGGCQGPFRVDINSLRRNETALN